MTAKETDEQINSINAVQNSIRERKRVCVCFVSYLHIAMQKSAHISKQIQRRLMFFSVIKATNISLSALTMENINVLFVCLALLESFHIAFVCDVR